MRFLRAFVSELFSLLLIFDGQSASEPSTSCNVIVLTQSHLNSSVRKGFDVFIAYGSDSVCTGLNRK